MRPCSSVQADAPHFQTGELGINMDARLWWLLEMKPAVMIVPFRMVAMMSATLSAMLASGRRVVSTALLAALMLFAVTGTKAAPFQPTGREGTYLVLSDIHFDPFTQPGLARVLYTARLEDWPAILRRRGTPAFAAFGEDSNYALMESALAASASLGQSYDYVLVVGDLISHDFPQNAEKALGSKGAARAFATKTSRFVASRIEARFGAVPVIPAIGNNDSDCGDYGVEPGGNYLRRLSLAWRVFRDHPEAARAFARSGSYEMAHPTVPNHRLLVVDSVFLSTDYADTCRPADADPGAATLDWIGERLADADRAGETVSLVLHIPPGFDGFASAGEGSTCRTAVSLWRPAFEQRFRAIADRHRRQLTVGIAGHLHTDGFRIFGTERANPYLPIHIVPSISPIYYNNPAFTVFLYDRRTAATLDYAVFFTQLDASPPSRGWAQEYRFSKAYDLNRVDADTLARLARRIGPDGMLAAKFKANFQVRAGQSIAPALWQSYLCAQTAATPAQFIACRCSP